MHEGHRERLKARFLRDGLESFEPHNVLELLLFYSIPRKDTNELAHRLMDQFGSLSGVLDAPYEEIKKVPGISDNTACLLKLITPLMRYYNVDKSEGRYKATSTEAIGAYLLNRYVGFTDEIVSILGVDNICRVTGFEVLGRGGANAVGFSSRKVMEAVLRMRATNVILCHNHPGGLALPSDQDVQATIRIRNLLNTIGVRLLDHIILVENDFVSMADSEGLRSIFLAADPPTLAGKEKRAEPARAKKQISE